MIYAEWKRKYNGGFIFIKVIRTLTQQKLHYNNYSYVSGIICRKSRQATMATLMNAFKREYKIK